jgi:hypothetical protein
LPQGPESNQLRESKLSIDWRAGSYPLHIDQQAVFIAASNWKTIASMWRDIARGFLRTIEGGVLSV